MLNRTKLMRTKTKRKIKKIVNYKADHPLASLADIGHEFGYSKQYIHKVLQQENVPTSVSEATKNVRNAKRRGVQYCLVCEEPSKRKVHLGECHFKYYNPIINCAACRAPFHRKRSKIRDNHTRGYVRHYCSRACYNRGQGEFSKQSVARQ